MTRILETLLGLARGGRGDTAISAVDLATLAARRLDAWRDVAAQRGVGYARHGGFVGDERDRSDDRGECAGCRDRQTR